MFSEEIVESIKSFIRIILIAIIPLVISQLQEGSVIDIRAVAISGSIAGLYALQDWLHEKKVKTPLDFKGGVLDSLKEK